MRLRNLGSNLRKPTNFQNSIDKDRIQGSVLHQHSWKSKPREAVLFAAVVSGSDLEKPTRSRFPLDVSREDRTNLRLSRSPARTSVEATAGYSKNCRSYHQTPMIQNFEKYEKRYDRLGGGSPLRIQMVSANFIFKKLQVP